MFSLQNIQFVHPYFLLLLLLIPLVGIFYWHKQKKQQITIKLSSLKALENSTSWRGKLREGLPILRALAFILLVIALARPQRMLKEEQIKAEGIDIAMVIDLSSSMLAKDFDPDRLEVSKLVAAEFVSKRRYDRVGLIVFAGEAFTQCPLTTDHQILQSFLANLQCGILEDGTAIGMGLAAAVNRLKDSEIATKVVILLTDGVNNSGYIKPITAAEIAKSYGIKVYTIGIGTTGSALAPTSRLPGGRYKFSLVPVEIDESLLQEIAEMTGGKYFRAVSSQSLQEIYNEIDQLEKTEIEVSVMKRYSEEFHWFSAFAFFLLTLELLLRYTLLRSIP